MNKPKKKKKIKLAEHTVPYSPGASVDWDNIFDELDEMFYYGKDKSPAGQRAANLPFDNLSKRVPGSIARDPAGYKGMVKGTAHLSGPGVGPKTKDVYKMGGPKGVLPENTMDPSLEDLMRRYGVLETMDEADDTKTKDPTGMDWDTMFDEPTSKGDVSTVSGPADDTSGPRTTADLKRGSRADTARATANITPTAAMADLISRMNVPVDDVGVEPPEQALVPADITPDHVPATISRAIAMSDPHAINPTWHTVANLPGNMSRAILTLGKALFRAFTRTPTEDIVMIGNVGGQGPNSTREINGVAAWLKKNGREVDAANIDFEQSIPGYSANVKHYTAGGIRFKVVRDQFGDYIYAWPEKDSIGSVEQVEGPARDMPRGRLGR